MAWSRCLEEAQWFKMGREWCYLVHSTHCQWKRSNIPNKKRELHPEEVEVDVRETKNKSLWLNSKNNYWQLFKNRYEKISNKYIGHVPDYIFVIKVCGYFAVYSLHWSPQYLWVNENTFLNFCTLYFALYFIERLYPQSTFSFSDSYNQGK